MLVSVYEKTRRNPSRACPQGRNKLQGVRPLGLKGSNPLAEAALVRQV
jgi:hypothetical protein